MGRAAPKREAFLTQKHHALTRGIEWLFNFESWCKWWQDQLGDDWLKKRGRRHGQYVMARFNDIGPYSEQNVKCILHEVNSVEGHIGKPLKPETIEKIRIAITGKKRSDETKALWSLQRRGRPGYFKGKKHSEESKLKMKISQRARFSAK